MDAFDQEVKDTRKDWTVETWADEFGFWYAKVSSEVGWGNAGTRDIDRHFGAMRERARERQLSGFYGSVSFGYFQRIRI